MSKNNEKDHTLTVSQVYETLKSPTFLNNLYWDILSGIKEKNTYKLMREITEEIVDQNMEGLEELNSSTTEEVTNKRKAVVAELSFMSYTINKVFSKILYMKLEKACKEQIVKIFDELKDEGKIPEEILSKFNISGGAAGVQGAATENKTAEPKSTQQKKVVQVAPTRVGNRRRKVSRYVEVIKKTNTNKEILDDLKKVKNREYSEENTDSGNSVKGNIVKKNVGRRAKEFLNDSTVISDDASSSLKTLTKENLSILNNSTKDSVSLLPMFGDSQDSSDSECSFARLSSVSSVHTSDLSSFDDEISLSDDESGQKKKIPLTEAVKKYCKNGHLDSTATKSYAKSSKSSESKVTKVNNASKNISQAASFEPSAPNELPKRARKPNSKYSSDNVLCPAVKVKERKKAITAVKTYGKMSSDESSPQSKKAKVDDDIYGDVVTITQSINEGKSSTNVKTPAKQRETPNLFRSRSATRPLTSRKTAAVTLFST